MSDNAMSDDLHIPAPGLDMRAPLSSGYRARRDEPEALRKYLVMGMAGLGAAVLVGMTGWAVMGRRPAAIPVIEADSRPIRVKPENPGGMQVAGADEQDGAEKMAPPPETPAPQALRAQMLQAAPTAGVSPPAMTAPTVQVPATAAPPLAGVPAIASALVNTPSLGAVPPPARLAAPTAAPPAVTPPTHPVAGGTMVQLAAVDSEAAAQAEWQRLVKKWPDLLANRHPAIQKAERDGKAFWRIRTGGFTDIADATAFCTRLRGKGAGCTIASF